MTTWRVLIEILSSGLYLYPITIRNTPSMTTIPKWDVGVRQYPVFAEYSEGRAADGSAGLSDTGFTMRALLPVNGQENRSSIHRYEGFSQVFYTQVVCLRPNITYIGVGSWQDTLPVRRGNLSVPSDLADIATASHIYGHHWSEFSCHLPSAADPYNKKWMYHPSDWKLSICQCDGCAGNLLPVGAYGVSPEERASNSFQESHLLMNFTGMISPNSSESDTDPIVSEFDFRRMYNDSNPGLVRENNADWVDIYRMAGNYTTQELATRLSFSLCFSAFQPTALNISASSSVPLVEPRYQYDPESGRLNFGDVRKQLLTSSGPIEDRGILSLAPQSWSAWWNESMNFMSPYFGSLDAGTLLQIPLFDNASTLHLVESTDGGAARADVSIGGLVLDILRSNGTTAEAVQSMMMVALESRYQDYFFSRGDGIAREGQSSFSTQRADFIAVQIPGGNGRSADHASGATLSYLLIMSTIIIHSTVVCGITTWYLKGMSFLSSFDQQLKQAQQRLPLCFGKTGQA